MQEIEKYYAFHIKLISPDTPGFNPGHYVIYLRKLLFLNRGLNVDFYFDSSAAAQAYTDQLNMMKQAPDPNEYKGYAARKYEDDILSRAEIEETYIAVGAIQYPSFTVELILKKNPHSTDLYFVSGTKSKLGVLYETVDLKLQDLGKYGISLERGPEPAELQDEELISAFKSVGQLINVNSGDIARIY